MRIGRPRFLLVLGLFLTLPWAGAHAVSPAGAAYRPAVHQFVTDMAARHDFDRTRLGSLLEGLQMREDVLRAISRPAESMPWHRYRLIFVNRARVEEGVRFWERHGRALARAEAAYGVPAEIIVAIIGVETRYGRHTGRFPVLESLTTLAFAYPPRGAFFRSELEQFLLLARDEELDPAEVTGSYAGAMGTPQFIASSYRRFAVDFDGDGRRDLWDTTADAIGSVANYFRVHDWRPGGPVAARARPAAEARPRSLVEGLEPRRTVSALTRAGLVPQVPLAGEARAAVIALEARDRTEYWLGLHNFYVITRYNHSALYAMAVYQLSQEIVIARARRAAR